ncbi:MAG: stage III sporulation protein AE [Clostridia bacterium]|nr:stage III sporulation protein AE [Clostridia bacterium]
MKRWMILFVLLCLLPGAAFAQSLQQSAQEMIGTLDLNVLDEMADTLLESDAKTLLMRMIKGETVLTAQEVWQRLLAQAAGVFQKSIWRMTRLMIPALLVAAAEWLHAGKNIAGDAARYAGMIMTMTLLVSDLREHTELATQTVDHMANSMQAIFPVMVTLLAAVGGTASSAFYQPAVIGAAGAMTTLVHQVTMPLAVSMAVLTMVGGLSEGLRLSRMCRLFRQAAGWTLGLGFTIFVGVMTVQGVNMAALDGVSIRTAKYAIDHIVPIVGGMFSDTVDTLVGCSLIVHNAVGLLGLLVLLSTLLLPLIRTALTMFLYRAAAALIQPLSDHPLCRAIGGYADVFSLLFIIQLSVGAMFFLLVAQLITVADLTVMLR